MLAFLGSFKLNINVTFQATGMRKLSTERYGEEMGELVQTFQHFANFPWKSSSSPSRTLSNSIFHDKRAVAPRKKVLWNGSCDVTSGGGKELPVNHFRASPRSSVITSGGFWTWWRISPSLIIYRLPMHRTLWLNYGMIGGHHQPLPSLALHFRYPMSFEQPQAGDVKSNNSIQNKCILFTTTSCHTY